MAHISKVKVVRPGTPPVSEEATIVSDTPGEFRKKETLYRTYQLLWYVLGVIETIMFLRFLFKVLGANTFTPFVRMLYGVSGVFVGPFLGTFPIAMVDRYAFEWATIVAMIMYALIAYGIVHLIQFFKPTSPHEVEEAVDNP